MREKSGSDGGSSGHPVGDDDQKQKSEEATAVLKCGQLEILIRSIWAFRRLMGVLVRCQTLPVVSLGENSEQIFGWKQREDDWNSMMMIMRIAPAAH